MKFIKLSQRDPSTGSPSGIILWVRVDSILTISNSNKVTLSNGESFYFTDDLKDTLGAIDDKLRTKTPSTKEATTEAQQTKHKVGQVIEHYRVHYPQRAKTLKPGSKNWKLIESRVKDGFSVEELKKAIEGNKLCKWHQSRPAGTTISYIFRNTDKVWGFIALADGTVSPDPDSSNLVGHHKGSKEFADGEVEDF